MGVYTDSPDYAATVLASRLVETFSPVVETDSAARPPLHDFFRPGHAVYGSSEDPAGWDHLLVTAFAPRSNYDALIRLARRSMLPDRMACLAGSGVGFHGYKGRSWAAAPGNLHLSVHLRPDRPVARFEVAFTILAALSVVEAVDAVPGLAGAAGVKWVNDVVLDGAKIAGVLAYTQSGDAGVRSAVLGMGVNVETAPGVAPTPFVPRVSCLRDRSPAAAADLRRRVLAALLDALARNYATLLAEGYLPLLERYRARSVVVGREVTIATEDSDAELSPLVGGKVVCIGDGLELYLEGSPVPVTRGRLVLDGPAAVAQPAQALPEHRMETNSKVRSAGGRAYWSLT